MMIRLPIRGDTHKRDKIWSKRSKLSSEYNSQLENSRQQLHGIEQHALVAFLDACKPMATTMCTTAMATIEVREMTGTSAYKHKNQSIGRRANGVLD